MIVVSIDPGVRACGVALWLWPKAEDPSLLAAAHVKSGSMAADAEAWHAMARAVWGWVDARSGAPVHDAHLVIEFPQTYGGKSAKGDTNDLLQLAAVVSALTTWNRERTKSGACETVWRPREWKGNLPKEVTMHRVDARLSDAEKKRVVWPAASLKHNVYDAIAIGQKFFSRESSLLTL